MRIIAGEFRGRRLLPPADAATRPITDRVKQSLFDILSRSLPDATAWDLFSGTGSLGLEALSRGARTVLFFERHRPAVERLRRNIQTLAVEGRARVITRDILSLREPDLAPLDPPDIVFFDPPYPYVRDRPADLENLLKLLAGRLAPGGRIVFRLEKGVPFSTSLPVLDDRAWGSMRILFLGAATIGGGR